MSNETNDEEVQTYGALWEALIKYGKMDCEDFEERSDTSVNSIYISVNLLRCNSFSQSTAVYFANALQSTVTSLLHIYLYLMKKYLLFERVI